MSSGHANTGCLCPHFTPTLGACVPMPTLGPMSLAHANTRGLCPPTPTLGAYVPTATLGAYVPGPRQHWVLVSPLHANIRCLRPPTPTLGAYVYCRRPCSDFMDMLRRLISCIIIIIIGGLYGPANIWACAPRHARVVACARRHYRTAHWLCTVLTVIND